MESNGESEEESRLSEPVYSNTTSEQRDYAENNVTKVEIGSAISQDAKTADSDFLQAWRESSRDRPVCVLVCGQGGVGKSTLINRLLRLKGEQRAEEGRKGGATTTAISSYDSEAGESGVKVRVFDIPGFDDPDMSNAQILGMVETRTERKIDIVFYCISLDGATRLQGADVSAMQMMTQVYSRNIWKNAVVVLTFANVFEEKVKNAEEYRETIARITEKVKETLRNTCHLSSEIVNNVSVITAGYEKPHLKYEAEECKDLDGWENRLFITALREADPDIVPALFEVRWSWRDAVALLSGGGGGALVCVGVGAGVGAAICAFGGPIGIAVGAGFGALVGGGVGAGVGGVGGAGAGLLMYQFVKIKSVLKVKYEKWKLKHKKKL